MPLVQKATAIATDSARRRRREGPEQVILSSSAQITEVAAIVIPSFDTAPAMYRTSGMNRGTNAAILPTDSLPDNSLAAT
ncbi:MAG: hypothetical protein JWP40_1151 [Blastococcus sp.]|nr:hypothetical protein [Blastococcus sp.]